MAAHFYRIAADLHNPYGLYKTGQYIEKGFHQYNTDEEARIEMFKAYKSAIEFGNVEATLRLAKIYEKGEHSVQLNKDKALELYEQICSNNQALNNIGTILYERAQYKRAADYFRKATAKGNLESMSNLAICYELGKGVYKDLDKAYELYQESAKKDNPQAMSNLGFLLYYKY